MVDGGRILTMVAISKGDSANKRSKAGILSINIFPVEEPIKAFIPQVVRGLTRFISPILSVVAPR